MFKIFMFYFTYLSCPSVMICYQKDSNIAAYSVGVVLVGG